MSRWGFFMLIIWTGMVSGCTYVDSLSGKDEMVQTSQRLEPFNAVVIETSVKLFLSEDTCFKVEIKGPDWVVSKLKIEQKEQTVVIGAGGAGFSKKQAASVILHASSFKNITANFPAVITSLDTLKTEVFSLVVNGRGAFTESHLTMKAWHFSLSCYGSNVGTHTLCGEVEALRVQSEGLTVVDAGALEADQVSFVQRSVNPAYVFARNLLEVRMESSGNLYFYGQPQISVVEQSPPYEVQLGRVMKIDPIE